MEAPSEAVAEVNNTIPSNYFRTFIKVEHIDNESSEDDNAGSDWIDDDIKKEIVASSSTSDAEGEPHGPPKCIKLAKVTKKKFRCSKEQTVPKKTSVTNAGAGDSDSDVQLDPSITNERKGLCNAYDPQFKLQVLSYAERHSTSATAAKFKITSKRIKAWKSSRSKIEAERDGSLQRRPRGSCYSIEQRLEAVAFAEAHTIDEAKVLYDVHSRTIEKWRQKKTQMDAFLQKGKGDYKRSIGGGRKPGYSYIEADLRDWVVKLRGQGIAVTYDMILNKAKILVNNGSADQNIQGPSTRSWVIGFLTRHNLVGQLGLTFGQPDDPQNFLSSQVKVRCVNTENLDVPELNTKRLRKTISLQDKVNIIERIQSGETQMDIVRSAKLSHSTVQTIWSSKDMILANFENSSKKSNGGSYVQWNAFVDVNKPLHDWVQQCISTNVSLDEKMLLDKTLEICSSLNKANYQDRAEMWVKRFCKKHKLNFSYPQVQVDCSTELSSKLKSTNYVPANSTAAVKKDDCNFRSDFDFVGIDKDQSENINQSHSVFIQNTYVPVEGPIFNGNISNTTSNGSLGPADAMKHLTMLRDWITDNYGNEERLHGHVDAIENAIIKKLYGCSYIPMPR